MCQQCKDIETQIAPYRRFVIEPLDRLTVSRFEAALRELEEKRKTIRCEDMK
jgi:hypothetical protein